MAKLVDAPDLGSGDFGRVGSSPIRRTPVNDNCLHTRWLSFFCPKTHHLSIAFVQLSFTSLVSLLRIVIENPQYDKCRWSVSGDRYPFGSEPPCCRIQEGQQWLIMLIFSLLYCYLVGIRLVDSFHGMSP